MLFLYDSRVTLRYGEVEFMVGSILWFQFIEFEEALLQRTLEFGVVERLTQSHLQLPKLTIQMLNVLIVLVSSISLLNLVLEFHERNITFIFIILDGYLEVELPEVVRYVGLLKYTINIFIPILSQPPQRAWQQPSWAPEHSQTNSTLWEGSLSPTPPSMTPDP